MYNPIFQSCSFFGHNKIEITDELRSKLIRFIVGLIENERVSVFYFGGFCEFDELCHKIVTELKKIILILKEYIV